MTGDLAGTFYRHSDMTADEQKSLIDKHFLFRGKDAMQAASGYHAFWPAGRGIFVSNDEKFLLWINEGDHLRIISMEKGGIPRACSKDSAEGLKPLKTGLSKSRGGKRYLVVIRYTG